MKKAKSNNALSSQSLQLLYEAIAALNTSKEVASFMHDLCTPAEQMAMADRWQVVALILAGKPYRQIHEETGVSITTIGRVARCISYGTGSYRQIYERLRNSHAHD